METQCCANIVFDKCVNYMHETKICDYGDIIFIYGESLHCLLELIFANACKNAIIAGPIGYTGPRGYTGANGRNCTLDPLDVIASTQHITLNQGDGYQTIDTTISGGLNPYIMLTTNTGGTTTFSNYLIDEISATNDFINVVYDYAYTIPNRVSAIIMNTLPNTLASISFDELQIVVTDDNNNKMRFSRLIFEGQVFQNPN